MLNFFSKEFTPLPPHQKNTCSSCTRGCSVLAACGFVWPRRHLPIPSHHSRCAYGHSCSESSRGWGCVVTGVGVCVGPWAFVVRDLWVGGGGGWLSWGGEWWDSPLSHWTGLSPTLHPLTTSLYVGVNCVVVWWCGGGSLRLNEGPAHAGVQRAHQCLSTLSLLPHEQLPRHLTDLLSHTLHQPR